MGTKNRFPKFDNADKILAAVYFLVGYGFISLFLSDRHSLPIEGFVIFYGAVVLLYLKLKKVTPPKESWFWLAVMLAIGVPFRFWSVLELFQFLLLMAAAAYWTLSATGRLVDHGKTSSWVIADCWNAFFWLPFSNFTCQLRVAFGKNEEEPVGVGEAREDKEISQKRKEGRAILLGLLLALPILLLVLPLLSRADMMFENLLGDLVGYIQENLLFTFVRLLLAIPVSLYLYGLIFGGITGRNMQSVSMEQLEKNASQARILPTGASCTVLTVLCLVYMIFIGVQGNYLFSAFSGNLPEDFTYAEYARRGFFELCQIGAWNLVFLWAAGAVSKESRREHKGLRFLTIALSVLTLLLIVTAMSKMGMYIDVYGLTVNRILPMVFMVWLVLVFGAVILRQRKEFALARLCIFAGAVLVCLLCVFPIENWVESYNIWARMKGLIL